MNKWWNDNKDFVQLWAMFALLFLCLQIAFGEVGR